MVDSNDDQLSERAKKLEMLKKQITNNKSKKGSAADVSFLSEVGLGQKIEAFSTGSLSVDIATGVGGIPRGRITEIYGPESSGKTTLALHAIASAQQEGGIAAFIDAEHALDPEYAGNIGVDTDELLFSQPESGEAALQAVEMLVNSKAVDIIVIDSVAALVPSAELKGEIGDSHVGLQARMMSQALRKITAGIAQSNTAVIFINQLREKVGVFFGSPETTSGGKALKFYASMRLDVRRIGSRKDNNNQPFSNQTRVKVVKNKVAPPFKEAESDIVYGQGFSRELDVLTLGINKGIIKKSGSWLSYDGQQVGQGHANSAIFLENNPLILKEIEGKIMSEVNQEKEEKQNKIQEKRNKIKEALQKAEEELDTQDLNSEEMNENPNNGEEDDF